jgi:excisionase family DNA binding protein
MAAEKFIGVEEAAELLGIAKPTLYNYCYRASHGAGDIPFYKMGGLKFLASELTEWVKKKKVLTREELHEKYGLEQPLLYLIA